MTIRSNDSSFLDLNDNFQFDAGGATPEKKQRWNIGAVFANSVGEALKHTCDWDVVLTDYHFESGPSGLDLVEQMQTRARSFALITANPGDDVLERAEAMHAYVIRKPVAPATLRTFLSRAWLRKSGNI